MSSTRFRTRKKGPGLLSALLMVGGSAAAAAMAKRRKRKDKDKKKRGTIDRDGKATWAGTKD